MRLTDELITTDIAAYLTRQEEKSLLRFITCGSVDDGKSTLIGRLLYDSKMIFEDQLAALEADSRKMGTQGENIDFALLVDGLAAEREQGITIDVAYRFFSTDKRKFIVADTPGHEQYTRNMATGASTADLAILLVDARKGIITQTRRHAFIVTLLGIRKLVLAVNKMDLVDWDPEVFDAIDAEFYNFSHQLAGDLEIQAIPLSALNGDNMLLPSERMKWYNGPTLLQHLEGVSLDPKHHSEPFRLPVQWVNRPDSEFRGFSGTITSGAVKVGDRIRSLPSARESEVTRIVTYDGDLPEACAGQAVTLTLADEIDTSRGDILACATASPEVSDQFQAHILWMSEADMLPGRRYLMRIGTQTVTATINAPKYRIDVNDMQHRPARTLGLNDIGVCTLSLEQPIAYDPFTAARKTGSFILLDRNTNDTIGMGLIDFGLRRAENIHWQTLDISRDDLADLKSQRPAVLWFTGISGSGKSTIANALQRRLHSVGKHTFLMDGDNVRHGLNRDLGFTDADRVENIRRVSEVAKLMSDAGLITIVSFISPFEAERQMARRLMQAGEFVEIFIDTPLAVAEGRDVKGLYRKARAGEILNFTGINSPYEPPAFPEIRIDTTRVDVEAAAGLILDWLSEKGFLDR
ncbi:sulfate adenylyltransferase subunit CysN [Hyphomonas sp. NPDC076900]|uniref:sulfate adenylyltransferase subunit CysN n=1 Tax=unclassified Hyphomonas TaxID=2630699 RepID=UPI003D024640